MTDSKPAVLIVLDGWGHRTDTADNAIAQGNTPVWDKLWSNQPATLISGSGLDVGLPEGQMGNSEVGHMNLGAGRVIHQDFTRITLAIEDGSFSKDPLLTEVMQPLAETGKALHLMGLTSPGGVHSHEDHLMAAVSMAREHGVSKVYLHAFLDGRDVPPKSAEPSLRKLDDHIKAGGEGGIASIIGRYYAMDRDNRWERVKPAWDLIVDGTAEHTAADPITALMNAYDREETDEFVQATAISINGQPIRLEDGDALVFMNFRADRARQLSRSVIQSDFDGFDRPRQPALSRFITLTEYASDILAPCVFAPESIHNSLGEYVASLGKQQLRLAETEKYAHVTFFFSGGREAEFEGETRLLVPSPNVATYDLQPEMSAAEVTDALVDAITSGKYELIVCNYANGDMVGHTGNLAAAIKAVECLDECLGRVVTAVEAADGHCLITADHGNCEQMIDHTTNQPHTAHTSELVPLIYVGSKDISFSDGGVLSDIAPTLLELMEVPQPREMTGHSLLAPVSFGSVEEAASS